MAAAAPKGDEMELAEDQSAIIEVLPELYRCFLYQNRYTSPLNIMFFFLKFRMLILLFCVPLDRKGWSPKQWNSSFLRSCLFYWA